METARVRHALALLGVIAAVGTATYWVVGSVRRPAVLVPPVVPADLPFVRDLGEVCHGTTISEEFTYRNRGARTLRVESVTTNCGCTASRVSPHEVEPGAIGAITLITDLNERTGYEWKTQYKADVVFAGYSTPVSMELTVLVVRDLPTALDFGRVLPDDVVHTRTFLARSCEHAPDFTSIESDNGAISGQFLPSEREPEARLVEVTLRAPDDPGLFVAHLTFVSAREDATPRVVTVRATVAARIESEPESLLLGTIEPQRRYSYALRIASRLGEPFEVRNATTSVPGLSLRWSAADTQHTQYNVQAELEQPDVVGSIAGNLEVTTSDPRCPAIVVPVYGVCAMPREAGAP